MNYSTLKRFRLVDALHKWKRARSILETRKKPTKGPTPEEAEITHLTETRALKSKTSQYEGSEIIESLEAELEKLQRLTNFGLTLRVVWAPGGSSEFSGTVKNDVIYVFEEDRSKVLEILRHEFVDWVICQAIKPFEKVTALYAAMFNTFVEKLQTEAYEKKEKSVDALVRLLSGLG